MPGVRVESLRRSGRCRTPIHESVDGPNSDCQRTHIAPFPISDPVEVSAGAERVEEFGKDRLVEGVVAFSFVILARPFLSSARPAHTNDDAVGSFFATLASLQDALEGQYARAGRDMTAGGSNT